MADKRDIQRHCRRLKLKFGSSLLSQLAFTEDISPQGIFIKTANVCPTGSRIDIELILPDHSPVNLEGRVAWAKKCPPNLLRLTRKCGMGVEITRILGGEEEFRRYCEELRRP